MREGLIKYAPNRASAPGGDRVPLGDAHHAQHVRVNPFLAPAPTIPWWWSAGMKALGWFLLLVFASAGWVGMYAMALNTTSPQTIEACPTPKPVRGRD